MAGASGGLGVLNPHLAGLPAPDRARWRAVLALFVPSLDVMYNQPCYR